ncbi:FUSC family protein [Microbacterium lushaniae]|uniref:FUSC family protein n=1 Tax=Microbacterium lushaniae TaxID=2614639 RepID=A0A5J6L3F4_9MICO|nr:FUSC family protein [Microbacterium lushaniae]QEW02871.1 FUSC family protein [Microbacterium lushaniae]
MRIPATFRSPRRGPLLQVLKSAVAVVAAWILAAWLVQGPLPVFAAIAALLVVQPSLNQSFTKAIERSIGVVAGVVIASVLGILLGTHPWVTLLATAVALLAAWALKLTPGTSNQVGISALLVLSLGTATPGYAVDRVLETLIGAAIGFLVNLAVVPPVAIGPARDKSDGLGIEIADALDRLAGALSHPRTRAELEELLLTARLLRPMRDAAEKAIDEANDSLTFNPRGRRVRTAVARAQEELDMFGPISTQVIGMTRAVVDRYDPSIVDEPSVRAIAEQLRRAAHDVRLRVSAGAVAGPAETPPAEPPALTRPLQVAAPSADHWVLVGSLLVDLHRIHENLVGD